MGRKLVDIHFPKELKYFKEIKKEEKIGEIGPKLKFPKFNFKKFSFFSLVLAFLIFIFLSFKFSKAEIKIWPKTEELEYTEKVIVDTKASGIDIKNKVIPGKIFASEEIFSGEFSATGKVLKKAEGVIRLFNEYTTQDEVWREGTRFVSSEGKLFKSKDKIFVPGAKIENGKIKASYVDVPVEAAEGGKEYNIGPSEFSIVAFKGTPKYFKYYGKSFEPMKGGGEYRVVMKEDLENAEKSLIEKAKNDVKEILKNKIGEDFLFPENAILVEVLEKNPGAKEGDEVEKFNFQIKAKIKVIAFSKQELLDFSKEYISSQLKEKMEAFFPSLKSDFKAEVSNFDLGKMTLSLKMKVKAYPSLDLLSLKKSLADKDLNEAKSFLLAQPEFSRVKIEIFPFWVKKIPENINQIEISYPLID